jgi:hypothetical protein
MSFLKGFFSLFDWMSPKTLDESLEGLDESLQHLYDKMNWGKYHNPMCQNSFVNPSWNIAIDYTRSIEGDKHNMTVEQVYGDVKAVTSSQFLDEMLRLLPSVQFQPYAFYNEDMDAIETYFKDESCYTKTLNNNIELHISFNTGEVVGMNIFNVQKLIRDKGHFQ